MYFASNLKLLRKRLKKKQHVLADEMGLTRSTYSGYENKVASPGLEGLVHIAEFHNVMIDDLVRKDFSTFTPQQWLAFDDGLLADLTGDKVRILATVTDADQNEMIEMIPQKASAGYTSGFSDPDYIKVLPTFNLPFLSKNKKYRSFPIQGDSMPPVGEGSYVTGEFVQNWTSIKDGTPCILITKDEGIVFKVLHKHLDDAQAFQLCSTNIKYQPYLVKANDVLEIWKFVNYISPELPDIKVDDTYLTEGLLAVQKEIHDLKIKMDRK